MTRIAFTADLHCDDFGTKVDPATGLNARWIDTVAMARWIAEDAKRRRCRALIVGGDLSESRHPAPWRVAQIGEALEAFEGPTMLVRGNHDGARAGRSIVDVLAGGRQDWVGFSSPGIWRLGPPVIAGIPYLDRHHLRALPGFEQLPEGELVSQLGEAYLTVARGLYAQATASGAHEVVLVIHQALAGGLMSDTQAAFLGDQGLVVDTRALAAIGFDAILAGHFHRHQVLSAEPLVAYAGSPYRTDFGEEHQAKGYLLVDVEPGKASFAFVETPARRFVTIDWSMTRILPDVIGAVVRVRNVPPEENVAGIHRTLDEAGAFDVQEIRQRRPEASGAAGGLSESLTAPEALEQYFAGDDDREALVERGRGILAEAVA